MTIAINCWVLRNKNLDGIGYFTVNAVSSLIKEHPEVKFLILCDKKFTENYFDFPNVFKHRIFPAWRHPFLYVFYMEFVLTWFLKKHKPDVMLSTDGFLSLFSSCRQIPVIHDINFEHSPGDVKLLNRIYYKFFFKRFARKAARIATISEYSQKDIAEYYKIDQSKIDNVSCGSNSKFSPLEFIEVIELRNKWSGGKPYFFFVGSMHPRKNIKRLIEGFNLFKQKTASDFKLILTGSVLWNKKEIENAYNDSLYKVDIVFTGRLAGDDVKKYLGAAYALTFVPVFEGFGMPLVEAMQIGVPILCSNVTSLPEVAGDSALLVDPYSSESIANGMEKLFSDTEYRNQLIVKGFIREKLFSWSKTSQKLWDCISAVTPDKSL